MAIKEEQYDPGYEDAYGGAYAERGPEGDQAPSQTNGHCTFSTAENTGNHEQALLHLKRGVLGDPDVAFALCTWLRSAEWAQANGI